MIVGLLLFNRKKYPLYLAIIVPLIGMTLSLIKFGIPELISLSALFKVLEIIAVVCCVVLLLKVRKPNKSIRHEKPFSQQVSAYDWFYSCRYWLPQSRMLFHKISPGKLI